MTATGKRATELLVLVVVSACSGTNTDALRAEAGPTDSVVASDPDDGAPLDVDARGAMPDANDAPPAMDVPDAPASTPVESLVSACGTWSYLANEAPPAR